MKTKYIIFIAAAIFIAGFTVGRQSTEAVTEVVTETRYVKGDVIHDTVIEKLPYAVFHTDTVYRTVRLTDTVRIYEIIDDYFLTRSYCYDFSSDTVGTFKVDLSVSQNKAISAVSTIQPVYKTVTTERTVNEARRYMFFGTVGGNGSLDVQGQLGLIYRQRFVVSVSGFKFCGMERAGWMVNAGGMW